MQFNSFSVFLTLSNWARSAPDVLQQVKPSEMAQEIKSQCLTIWCLYPNFLLRRKSNFDLTAAAVKALQINMLTRVS